ncbi:MAG: P-loop NTPase [Pseudomonadales bacterium]|nr:P-loop NTPase [Pseudomonadales bacterium]
MSLIEKALQKMRAENEAAGVAAQAKQARPTEPAALSGPTSAPRRTPRQSIDIDSDGLLASGVLAPEDKQHQQVSDFRHIKRQVVSLAASGSMTAGTAARVIMVTSALPGEGKTFTAINLALSLALERDSSVLLVDGDIAKPNTSRLLNLERYPGLLDALADERIDVEDLVLGTNVKGLYALSAGKVTDTANEYLSSVRMDAVMQQLLADRNRYLVLDTPPLLVTTEAAAFARHAGQVLMVVRADSTVQRAVQDALHLLGERDGISLILNRVTHTKLEGYYYGYSYGERYGDTPVPKALSGI